MEELKSLPFLKEKEAEAIFDYWLDKCLSEKSKLTIQLKREVKNQWVKNIKDPYVAFRKCLDKINTRKNRAQDHANYVKMLDCRRQLASAAAYYEGVLKCDIEHRKFVETQMEIFEEQYQNESFCIDFLYNKMNTSQQYLDDASEDLDSSTAGMKASEDDHGFSFKRRADCQYFKVSLHI